MNKILKNIPKNTFFTTRLWIQQRVVLAGPNGTFNIVRIGFGQKIMCQIKVGLRSPLPTVEYLDHAEYTSVWLGNIVTVCSTMLGMPEDECAESAKVMLAKYSVDTYFKEALLDHFSERVTEEEFKEAGVF